MLNTVDYNKMQAIVKKAVDERRNKIYGDEKNEIKIIPELKQAILQSSQVSGNFI